MKAFRLHILVLLLFTSYASHGITLDTTGSWTGTISGALNGFGETYTATIGQTFTVGEDSKLNSFTFYLDDMYGKIDPTGNPHPDGFDYVDFAAYVMAWDGERAMGEILYQSSELSTTGQNDFEAFTINTGGLALQTGNEYIAFFSTSEFFDGIPGRSYIGTVSTSVYSGGDGYFMNNTDDTEAWTTQDWNGAFARDLAFAMEFSAPAAVPVPAAVWLFGSGLLGLVGVARRKKA